MIAFSHSQGAGLTSDGGVWFTTNLRTWTQIPGVLSQLVVGDFNRDGRSELAGLTSGGSMVFYTTDLQTWTHSLWARGPTLQLVVGDFNADGKDDLGRLATDGSVWFNTALSGPWTGVSGKLSQLVSGNFSPARVGDELAGLGPDGSIWVAPYLATCTNVPGTLSELLE